MKIGLAWKAALNRASLSASAVWARLRSMPSAMESALEPRAFKHRQRVECRANMASTPRTRSSISSG